MPGSIYDYARTPSPVRRMKTPRAYTSLACVDRDIWSPEGREPHAQDMYSHMNYYPTDQWRNVADIPRMEDEYLPVLSPRPIAPSPRGRMTPRIPSPSYEAELENCNHLQTFQAPQARLHSAYTRRIRNHRDESPPRMKSGRAGGSWRHISQTNGHQGNNIMFIEGTVKQSDSRSLPPYGWMEPDDSAFMHYVSPRVIPRQRPEARRPHAPKATNYTSYYNSHARQGFKYWYDEKKIKGKGAPLNSIQSRLLSLRT